MGKMMKGYGYGGVSSGPLKKKKAGGSLKPIPEGNKGLPELPTAVRNKMGYMMAGGSKPAMETGMMKYGGSCGKVYTYNRDIKSLI